MSRHHTLTRTGLKTKSILLGIQDNLWPSPANFSSSVFFHSSHWHLNHLLIFSSRHNAASYGCHIPFLLLALCFPTSSSNHCFNITASARSTRGLHLLPIRCLIYSSIILLSLYTPQFLPNWTIGSLRTKIIPFVLLFPIHKRCSINTYISALKEKWPKTSAQSRLQRSLHCSFVRLANPPST